MPTYEDVLRNKISYHKRMYEKFLREWWDYRIQLTIDMSEKMWTTDLKNIDKSLWTWVKGVARELKDLRKAYYHFRKFQKADKQYRDHLKKNPQTLKGMTIDFIAIDEVADWEPDDSRS